MLDKKYWFDEAYQFLFAGGSRGLGRTLWNYGDKGLIDGVIINGSARGIGWIAGVVRGIQSGYLFHYAIAMILGLLILLAWFVLY
jgi:NADH-quinone oxidoreductase subunit L